MLPFANLRSAPRARLLGAGAVVLAVLIVAAAAFWFLAVVPGQHHPAAARQRTLSVGNADLELARRADLGAPVAAATPAATSSTALAAPTGQLRIPSLNISGAVYPVGVDKNNTMEVTQTAFTVGWYKFGPLPGAAGDAVEECHNEWYTAPRALCYNLHNVATGADVYTTNPDGSQFHWKVTKVTIVPYNATVPGLFDTGGGPRLSIITCGGEWLPKQQIFTQRVIVDAVLAQSA